jgi:hypothetical protein
MYTQWLIHNSKRDISMTNLYELSIENYLRVVGASLNVLKKAEAHFLESAQNPEDILLHKLADDMFPFPFQVYSIQHHSLKAAIGLLAGKFGPPKPIPETNFAGLIKALEETKAELKTFSVDEINAKAGETVTFKMGGMELPFTTENFVQSFSLPNLYFHASTTYALLRMKGVPLGKIDFMGNMKIGV